MREYSTGNITFTPSCECHFANAASPPISFDFTRTCTLEGTYNAWTYFLSKLAMELPVTFLQMIIQYILVWNMMGMRGNFILLVLAGWGLGLASGSMAVLLGCSTPDVRSATEASPLLFVPQLLFAGFFVKTSQIPIFLRWAQYLCSLKYTMNLVSIDELRTRTTFLYLLRIIYI